MELLDLFLLNQTGRLIGGGRANEHINIQIKLKGLHLLKLSFINQQKPYQVLD